jgi:hypothetical protein
VKMSASFVVSMCGALVCGVAWWWSV